MLWYLLMIGGIYVVVIGVFLLIARFLKNCDASLPNLDEEQVKEKDDQLAMDDEVKKYDDEDDYEERLK
jgi:hypothetical protein